MRFQISKFKTIDMPAITIVVKIFIFELPQDKKIKTSPYIYNEDSISVIKKISVEII